MIEGFNHVGTDHKCSVCQCDFTDDEGGVQGYFGILLVAFCPTCFASMCDMAAQFNGREWEGLTEMEKAEIINRKWWNFEDEFDVEGFMRLIEAKLKEKNCEDQD